MVTVAEGGTSRLGDLSSLSSAPIVGRGAFATVFDIGAGRCAKVERLSPFVSARAHVCANTVAIWAGSKGIAPRVRSWRIACSQRSCPISVVEMDLVRGESLAAWASGRGRSRIDIVNMAEKLRGRIARLRGIGVVHGDLHIANVLVERATARPWLIDFTFARMNSRSERPDPDEAPAVVSAMWRTFETSGPRRLGRHVM
jgi:hypothetical protein